MSTVDGEWAHAVLDIEALGFEAEGVRFTSKNAGYVYTCTQFEYFRPNGKS